MIHLVTVKLVRDPNHDASKKVTGVCPVSQLPCTDVAGQHHTLAVAAVDEDDAIDYVRRHFGGSIHITRVEATNLSIEPNR